MPNINKLNGTGISLLSKWDGTLLSSLSSLFGLSLAPPLPLTTDLVASWDLDEVSGTRVDQSGNAYNLTDNNTVTQGAGVGAGQFAAEFVQVNNEYLSVVSNADLQIGNRDWTTVFWFYPATGISPLRYFLSKGNPAVAGGEYSLLRSDSRGVVTIRLTVRAVNDTTQVSVVASLPSTLDTWYMITAGFDASTGKAFVGVDNNALVDSAVVTGGTVVGTNDFVVGGVPPTNLMQGREQAARVWTRLLTTAERTALYNGGVSALLHADL